MSKPDAKIPATDPATGTDFANVNNKRVKCDGGGGALGHPQTWLDMGTDDSVECKYCGKLFIFKV